MHAAQVGEAALGERAQQVERRRGLVVAAHHALRIGAAGRGRRTRSRSRCRRGTTAARCRRAARSARSGAWRTGPAMRPTFSVGHAGAVGEHDRHLQDDLELVADVVGRELGERLRAVARVQQEAVALGDARQRCRAACAPRPRTRAAACARSSSSAASSAAGVGPVGLLRGGVALPARRAPSRGCGSGSRCGHRGAHEVRAGYAPARPVARFERAAAGASPRTAAAPASAG